MIYTKIGLAITFSPNGLALLKTALRYQRLFNAGLCLIHVGKKNDFSVGKMNELLKEAEVKENTYELIWKDGDPAKTIISAAEERKVDLLIAGALEKESLIQYYIGSVARKIMRESSCSVLILSNPNNKIKSFNRICVTVDYSPLSELAVKNAYEFSKLENSEEFTVIREYLLPALAITIYDSGSVQETQKSRVKWQKEEEEKLKNFLIGIGIDDSNVKTVCLYGKQGWEAKEFAKENKSDLLVVSSPQRKLKLVDRIFQHDLEFIFDRLPCSLLIVKK